MTDLYGAPHPKPKREPKPPKPIERGCWTCNHGRPTLNAAGRRDPNRDVRCLWKLPPFDWPESYIGQWGPPKIYQQRSVSKYSGKTCKCWTPKEKT